ncbi:MAG: GTP cyclohydrolase II RibA, partial [Candidatus Eremiobacteraeota bacterium]|nr:GTP cyclohydrolase II RibA [Candidatus Eremiobacteraeota bacterium]
MTAVPAISRLPTAYGTFVIHGFEQGHLALVLGDVRNSRVLGRIHSSCITSEAFGSLRCDCAQQLDGALEAISMRGQGILIYLQQEGRGIGLIEKLRAYNLQDQGLDTVDANRALGHPDDGRTYQAAVEILRHFDVSEIDLLTNNPQKVQSL